MGKMEHLLQIPKCSKLPLSHKDGEEQRMSFCLQTDHIPTKNVLLSSNCSSPIRGPLANHFGGPLTPTLGFSYSKSQSDPISFHHPLNIHQSQASKVQYIMYPTIMSHSCSFIRPVGQAPIGTEISQLSDQPRCLLHFESLQNVTAACLTSTWYHL